MLFERKKRGGVSGHIRHFIDSKMHVFLNFIISGVIFDAILALSPSLIGNVFFLVAHEISLRNAELHLFVIQQKNAIYSFIARPFRILY